MPRNVLRVDFVLPDIVDLESLEDDALQEIAEDISMGIFECEIDSCEVATIHEG